MKRLDVNGLLARMLIPNYTELRSGIILYRINHIRILHISDATGSSWSGLIPIGDRPSAAVRGVATRTTNGNLATSFGRITVGTNGDVSTVYASALNSSGTGYSVVASTDQIIGTVVWHI